MVGGCARHITPPGPTLPLDASDTPDKERLPGGLENAPIVCSGEPELHSSAMQVWGDSELEMAMS